MAKAEYGINGKIPADQLLSIIESCTRAGAGLEGIISLGELGDKLMEPGVSYTVGTGKSRLASIGLYRDVVAEAKKELQSRLQL